MPLWTNEEYTGLQRAHKLARAQDRETIQKLCTLVATHQPIKFWGRQTAEPWGCILNTGDAVNFGYCDQCPVQDMCPCEHKEYSK